MRQSQFIAQSSIPASLIRAVSRQIGSWDYFTESAENICQGADGGWNGFTWYSDTTAFFRRNRKAILELAEQMADDCGDSGMLAMIAGFNCLRQYKFSQDDIAKALYMSKGDDVTTIQNAMAWFALEEVARAYCDVSYVDSPNAVTR